MGLTKQQIEQRAARRLIAMLRARANVSPRGVVVVAAELVREAADRLEELTGGPRPRLGQGVWK